MSKSVVLVLESSYEQDYGEHANIPVFNAHGEIIGWTGGDVPEYGHPCEFNALNDEGFTSCASSATVNRLRAENAKLRELLHDVLRHHMFKGIPKTCEESAKIAHEEFELGVRAHELGIYF